MTLSCANSCTRNAEQSVVDQFVVAFFEQQFRMQLRAQSSSLFNTRQRRSGHFERSGSTRAGPTGHSVLAAPRYARASMSSAVQPCRAALRLWPGSSSRFECLSRAKQSSRSQFRAPQRGRAGFNRDAFVFPSFLCFSRVLTSSRSSFKGRTGAEGSISSAPARPSGLERPICSVLLSFLDSSRIFFVFLEFTELV